jgi:hypothetical protein
MHLNNIFFDDGENIFAIPGQHPVGPGKTAESRQHAEFFGKIKTGETQGLLSLTPDTDTRMYMSREKIISLWEFYSPA